MDFWNEQKPIPRDKPAAGKLLIAEPFLVDPNFARTVILVTEHGEEGTVGFILNRSTQLTLGDLIPELYTPELAIYQGGPVQLDTLHMIHRTPDVLGGNKIANGMYWGGSYETFQTLMEEHTYDTMNMKMYVGYSGWGAGQLDKEMDEGSWIVADANEKLLFDVRPEQMWKEAIKLLGREYNYLAHMPLDPQLN
jgi:putative transcriptional regulator